MNIIRSISKASHFAGYFAIWPAMYALGVLLLAGHALAMPSPAPITIAYILICAHSCYLLDRVKIADHRQDPADALALPERAMLFAQFAKPIRALLLGELIVCTLIGIAIHLILGLIPIAALSVVHFYAGRGATPASPRLKDLPAVKAFVIASGHLALVLVILWSNEHDMLKSLDWLGLLAIIGIWMIVVGDAILCDIDDHDADLVYSTKSLAVMLGARSAWWSAIGFITIGSIAMTIAAPSMLWIGVILIITTMITRNNSNHRDFVDARLLPIVLISILLA